MSRLLLVSNRLPVSIEKGKRGLRFETSVGGLATGLSTFHKSHNSSWIGWPGIDLDTVGDKVNDVMARLREQRLHPVFISEQDFEGYYHEFSNKTIWPLFHYFPLYALYDTDSWRAYTRVNEAFAKAVVKVARDGDIIWVHDYHLMLLPRLIRRKLENATIGFFLHIPFPSLEVFRLLPWRSEILQGLLGADLVGFHTYDYAGHFLDSVRNLLGHEATMGQITADDRLVKVDIFPMGIDYERYSSTARNRKVRSEASEFRERLGVRKVILSVDRLDYTKGILERLAAYNLFLERHPGQREKLVLVLVVVPSRTLVEQYALLKSEIDELVGAINGKYGTIGWTPIWYLYRSLPFHSLVAMYRIADIALVTPVRDGMNLIAKEYIATRSDGKGVLILSETAGAARELGEAIVVNVNNQEEMVQALERALAMPVEEQIENNRTMQKRLMRYDVQRWAEEFVDRLLQTKKLQVEAEVKTLTSQEQGGLVNDFLQSNRRLLLLDYDGTLVSFTGKPAWARPSDEVTTLLQGLAGDPRNQVVLISGREKDSIDEWFGSLNIGLVAEHGVWVKDDGGEWEQTLAITNDWKEEVRPILELWVDRTPGSFIEEKKYSLVWHHRRCNPSLSEVRARELVKELTHLTANLNLHVLEGSRVVEVKNVGVNKGQAALQWLSRDKWDFILAAGDDMTDEDIFRVLPATAWSIKVGFGASGARFCLGSPTQVRSLLKEMIGAPLLPERQITMSGILQRHKRFGY
jgi:trehalose 6-phosphate synthase/phosphatase